MTSVNDITARHLDRLDSLRKKHAYQLNSWVGCNFIYLLISFIYFISSPTKDRSIATHNVAVYMQHCAYVNVLDEIAPGVKFSEPM